MAHDGTSSRVARRSLFSGLGAGLAAIACAPSANAQSQSADRWQPARDPQDDWLDTLPGKHRFLLDSVTPLGAGEAIVYATNYYNASKSGYRLENADLAVVLCLRHHATPFAFSDKVWAKYGEAMDERLKFADPKTNRPPSLNVYNASDYGTALPNRGITLRALIERGVHFAVCDLATRAFADIIAKKSGASSDDIYTELTTDSVTNAHFVPAGIVAVNRAQERGYSFAYVG